ncbi:MAG: DUF5606 domain-containing protein [Flavobacteriales bacterium]|nr:DUF5606 domain-containing protein [Flavobacteriales bacterium]
MHLSEILTISGKPGLYKIVAQNPGRVIVESIPEGKRMPIFVRHNFSILNDISIFTYDEDLPLGDVLKSIYEKEDGKETISHKADEKELEAKMLEVVPNYDKEEVRHADMRKLFKWYNLLIAQSLWTPEDMEEDDTESKDEEE